MAATEEIQVLQLSTGKSVQNVAELRQYIADLKKELNDENATVAQNAKTAEELRAAQAALRDAMYATTKSGDDYIKASKNILAENGDLTASYNDLVKDLADLRSAWRSTEDEMERQDLSKEIKRVNDALKDLDEATGSFKRNVGNYTDSFKKALSDIPSFAQPVKKALDDTTKSLALMGKQPILALVTLLAPVIMKITEALKDNETAQKAVQRVMSALEPVARALQTVIEKIAGWLSVATDRVLEWAGENAGAFKTVISGAVGVGNAILQFILTPIRNTVEAARGLGNVLKDVFTGQWGKIKEDAAATVAGIKDAFSRGFDFQGNFALGKQAGEAFIEGLGSARGKAKDTGRDLGAGLADGVKEGLEEGLPALITFTEEELARLLSKMDAVTAARLAAEKEAVRQQAELDAVIADQESELAEELNGIWEDYEAEQDARLEAERNRREAMRTILSTYADSVGSILGSLADAMEAESEGSEKVAQQVKNIRIAAAVIDTISGAVKAYMAAQSLTPPANFIVGGLNAATVTAAGVAQIAKIRATQISKTGEAGASLTPTVAAAATAPSIPQTVQQTAAVDTAYNMQQLNARTADQRVYILQSDLEASGRQVAVRQAETTF